MKKLAALSLLIAAIMHVPSFAQTPARFNPKPKECLNFLYKYMALPDSVDYSADFYKANIATTLKARREMPWGMSVPQREWMHFVLPVRINNENLDDSRMVFYRELAPRVKDLGMKEAVLEVNHWCHERVTYTPSDERTSSPLASVKTAYGRCGEESTLLVAALRAVGIPARQVYTPRWAHTDDNHAWVEAWADGTWYFLGACEPEPVLDLGWFNAPASRGLLMHTRVFGDYDGPEDVMYRTDCYTEINVTSKYAPVARRTVKIVDASGKPVHGALVTFRIYNYAEFFPVLRVTTREDGLASIRAGLGDMLVWASKDDSFGVAKCDMRSEDTLTVVLNHKEGERLSEDIVIVPPAERNTVPFVSEQARAENNRRLAYEDSLRNAYVAGFPSSCSEYVKAARGNWDVIAAFLGEDVHVPGIDRSKYLSTLSQKDLRDISAKVLLSNFAACAKTPNRGYPEDIYYKYVLCPRVANEMVRTDREDLFSYLSETEKAAFARVENIAGWVRENIRVEEQSNPQHLRMSAAGVYRHRVCDAVSRDIFTVVLCRTMGFAARRNPVDGKVEQYCDGQWRIIPVGEDSNNVQESSNPETKASLKVTYHPDRFVPDPLYYSHFTLSKLRDAQPVLLNFEEDDTLDSLFGWSAEGQASAVALDAGTYLLTSGRRMADGSVLVHIEVVPVRGGADTGVEFVLPQARQGLSVIGALNAETFYNDEANGYKSILSTTGRGFYVLGMVAPNDEPSIHALRDIAAVSANFEQSGIQTIILFDSSDDMSRLDRSILPAMPSTLHWGADIEGQILSQLTSSLHLATATRPVFVIADSFNRVVFLSEGYTIGLGEKLLQYFKAMAVVVE